MAGLEEDDDHEQDDAFLGDVIEAAAATTEAHEEASKRQRLDDAGSAAAVVTTPAAPAEAAPRFVLKLRGMDKHAAEKDLKKALAACDPPLQGLVKHKKVYKLDFATLWFDSEESRAAAVPIVEQWSIKNSGQLRADLVSAADNVDPRDARDARDNNSDRKRGGKRGRDNDNDEPDTRTPQEMINDQTTPLWRTPYPEQLISKSNRFKNGLGTLKKNLLGFMTSRDVTAEKKADLKYLTNMKRGDRLCPLEDVVPSPIIDDYRTKCEFTIGFDLEGKKTVGFLLGLYKEGITAVLEPTEIKNTSAAARFVASTLQEFVRNSDMPVYDRTTKEGFWRLVQVRTHTTGDVMVIVQINPANVAADVKQTVIDELSDVFQKTGKVTTFLVQESQEKHNGMIENAPTRVVFGDGVVYEELLGLRFRISPTAFFQINTEATNGLYGLVREWCQNPAPYPSDEPESTPAVTSEPGVDSAAATTAVVDPATATATPADATVDAATEVASATTAPKKKNIVLLDLCCGTGTIGLTMASAVKKVVGVEMVAEAIEDAKHNAAMQNAHNVHYICSKVEHAMKEVFSKHVEEGDEVVAVLDPPRNGVHKSVIEAVRGCKGINRVVF
ncbi:tRNA methyltransferase 2, partial [Podochytrium sp. JEL0797]